MFSLLTHKSYKKNKNKIFPKCDYILKFSASYCFPQQYGFNSPDHAGISSILFNNDKEIWGYCRYMGYNISPCEADYYALIIGLEKAIDENINMLSVFGDNLLVINQINNISLIEDKTLLPLFEKVNQFKTKFTYIEFNYIDKEDNQRAKDLSSVVLQDIY